MDTGGTEWELETAGKQMVAARREGDVESEVLALLRFSEGLRNSSMGVVGAVLAPLAGQLKELAEIVTNARHADLNWRTDERTRRDAQSDRLYSELDRLAAATEEAARSQKKSERDIGALSERIDESHADRQSLHEEIAGLGADIAAIKAVMDARPAQRVEERQSYEDRLVAYGDRLLALEVRLTKLDGGG